MGDIIKVAVVGALGKMGKEVIKAVGECPECELVCTVDISGIGTQISGDVHIEGDISLAFKKSAPDVVVDFTEPKSIFEHIKLYLDLGVKSVIGTTGLSSEQVSELEALSREKNTGCFIAPNFTTGAVMMMLFASMAAKCFKNAEIIEYHHNQKKDAPSGTALKTAQMMAEVHKNFKNGNCPEEELVEGARGGEYENIHIHAVRMPGFMASQEVIFGAPGQILTIRHDSVNRECYMPGVIMAVKNVFETNKFTYGLENIL
jgi:4-hydroxy-tetrahydrodipicolinate reductase